jgi:hypothetical protein
MPFTLMMEAVSSSQMLVTVYQTTRCIIPEDDDSLLGYRGVVSLKYTDVSEIRTASIIRAITGRYI